MPSIRSSVLRLGLAPALALFFSSSCTTYVRVPAVCAQDSFCLPAKAADHPTAPADRERVRSFIHRNAEATVLIEAFRYDHGGKELRTTGVGAVVGARGLVLTAYHVVAGADHLIVDFRAFNPVGGSVSAFYPAEIVSVSIDRDVAALVPKIPVANSVPLPVRYGPSIKNDDVWLLGAGLTLRRGTVVAIEDKSVFTHGPAKIDFAALPDDAGAPVMNACGEVVGILTWPEPEKRIGYFCPVDDALKALNITASDLR